MGATAERDQNAKRRRFPIFALLAWAALVFVIPAIVEPLNLVTVLGFPLGFFLVAQGSLIGLLLIGVVSARRLDRLAGDKSGET